MALDLILRRLPETNGYFHPYNHTSLLNKVRRALASGTPVGLVFLDIKQFHEILQFRGSATANRILLLLEGTLQQKLAEVLPVERFLAAEHLWADDFVILLTLQKTFPQECLFDWALAFRSSLKEELHNRLEQLAGCPVDLHLGCSVIEPDDSPTDDLRLYNALREAQRVAKGTLGLDVLKYKKEFLEILDNKQLNTLYQPIVSLSSGEILGWEALTRGPENSYFTRPDIIFKFAEELGLLFAMEKVCREKALSSIGELGPEQKLFLNVHPRTMSDPNFVKGETLQILHNHGLVPRNIVFEITERHSIKDFISFKQIIENYRSQGYRIAIDDVGAGFSGLQTIAEIRPDFIKIDMSLVRNIDSNLSRQSVVAALKSLAENINCKIIAEGIESQNELNALLLKGVHYAQGYYLARPRFPKPTVAGNIITYIRHRKITDLTSRGRYLCIGDLAVSVPVVGEETPVATVKELLDASRQVDSSLVVLKGQQTVGLVMRHNLHRVLSSQYGVPLYYQRPVAKIMDQAPLVLDGHTVLELAAELALSRDQDKLYDDLVVVDTNGVLIGVVSIQRLLETLTRMQIEFAKGTNPLTGLPGNLAIGEELSRRARYEPFSSVIYIDLDGFKCYNDTFGFKHGDQMIVLLSKIILHCTRKYGGEEDFIGHIGGDDLIVITTPECEELIGRQIIKMFDRLVSRCFPVEDQSRRTFYGYDRYGTQRWLPLTSVTLVVIECRNQGDYGSLAETAAQLKKYAKATPGSNCVRDRRAKSLE